MQPSEVARAGPGPDRGWALLLDFDGTVVDIADRPDSIVVLPSLIASLTRLRATLGALAMVSGRSLAALDHFLAPLKLDAVGLHGGEIRVAGVSQGPDCTVEQAVARAACQVRRLLAGAEGVLIEHKGGSVAVHWRQAPAHGPDARTAAERVAAALGAGFRVQLGAAVAEILPAAASKGHAITRLAGEPGFQGLRLLFIGDDVTDEHGFVAVNQIGGIGVKVGGGATVARYRLRDAAAVRGRLAAWAAGHPIDPDSDFDPA